MPYGGLKPHVPSRPVMISHNIRSEEPAQKGRRLAHGARGTNIPEKAGRVALGRDLAFTGLVLPKYGIRAIRKSGVYHPWRSVDPYTAYAPKWSASVAMRVRGRVLIRVTCTHSKLVDWQ